MFSNQQIELIKIPHTQVFTLNAIVKGQSQEAYRTAEAPS